MKKKYVVGLWLPALLLLVTIFALASCAGGGEEGSSSDEQASSGDEQTSSESEDNNMQDMDHNSESMSASMMLMENGQYSDERFIDEMVPHHQSAIEMAQVALQNAEHPEILTLANNIVLTQQAEIEQLKSIKQQQFGTSEVPMDMSTQEMEGMGMTMSPHELANQTPFDKAFIDNMIPHHQGAIEMANVVLAQSQNPEIRQIAGAIVEAQQREIEQMKGWRAEWYPEG